MHNLPSHRPQQPTVLPTDHTKGPPIQPPEMPPDPDQDRKDKIIKRVLIVFGLLMLSGVIYAVVDTVIRFGQEGT